MVFWEAEESALTLTRRAHSSDTEKNETDRYTPNILHE